jgi:DNA invertase Pin-like site-specific DNA recombinase
LPFSELLGHNRIKITGIYPPIQIPIHFIGQGFVTLDEKGEENPISKMIIPILGVGAEMERKLIKEGQLEGIAIAKLQNTDLGRKPGTKED